MDNKKQAKTVFDSICKMLDEQGLNYQKNEEQYDIFCDVVGEDLPINILINVKQEGNLVALMTKLPFVIPKEKKVDIAIAVNVINLMLTNGNFDFDFTTGNLYFKMTQNTMESLISKNVFEYMFYVSCKVVDDYNDKLLMITKTKMTIADIVKFLS